MDWFLLSQGMIFLEFYNSFRVITATQCFYPSLVAAYWSSQHSQKVGMCCYPILHQRETEKFGMDEEMERNFPSPKRTLRRGTNPAPSNNTSKKLNQYLPWISDSQDTGSMRYSIKYPFLSEAQHFLKSSASGVLKRGGESWLPWIWAFMLGSLVSNKSHKLWLTSEDGALINPLVWSFQYMWFSAFSLVWDTHGVCHLCTKPVGIYPQLNPFPVCSTGLKWA